MLPLINPDAFTVVVPQAIELRLEQIPEKTWILAPDVERSEPTALNVTVAVAFEATNEYHTSSSGVPIAQPVGILLLAVAAHTVPDVFAVPSVKAIAPEQSSFAGGALCVIQILNVAVPEGAPEARENTRT